MVDVRITQCPFCKTGFRVTERHLDIANGSVRCGSCLRVFMAELYFIDDKGQLISPGAKVVDFKSRRDELPSSHELRRRKVLQKVQEQLNEKQMKKNPSARKNTLVKESASATKKPSEADTSSSPEVEKKQISNTLDAKLSPEEELLSSSENILDELMGDDEEHWDSKIPSLEVKDIPAVLNWEESEVQLEEQERNYFQRVVDVDRYERFRDEITRSMTYRNNGLWFLLSAIMFVALAVQYLWFNKMTMSMEPGWRGFYEKTCLYIGCDLPDYVNYSELLATNLVIRSHPDVSDGLKVDALLRNESYYQQPFPNIELRFSTISGELLARRVFSPGDYLKGEMTGMRVIPPLTEVRLGLDVVNPGEKAVNYTLRIVEE